LQPPDHPAIAERERGLRVHYGTRLPADQVPSRGSRRAISTWLEPVSQPLSDRPVSRPGRNTMDEVKTMSRAGENVGKAVGTGMRGARHSARRASDVGIAMSKQAAADADHELAQRGVSTTELQDQLARRTTGMSRKELAKLSRKSRKQWGKRAA